MQCHRPLVHHPSIAVLCPSVLLLTQGLYLETFFLQSIIFSSSFSEGVNIQLKDPRDKPCKCLIVLLQLEAMPSLAERMAALMGVADTSTEDEGSADPEESSQSAEDVLTAAEQAARDKGGPVRWLELDDCGLDDAGLVALKLGEKYPVS